MLLSDDSTFNAYKLALLGKLQKLSIELGTPEKAGEDIVNRFKKRREERLSRRVEMDDEDEGEGSHGNTRIPFGLCLREGIRVDPGWGPREAWEALEKKGYSASGVYRDMSELSKLDRDRNLGNSGGSLVGRVINENIRNALRPEKDQAVFFSNCSMLGSGNVKSSVEVAREYADGNGGVTMEKLLDGTDIPEWEFGSSGSMSRWEGASRAYAEQASGNVRVIARPPMRKNSIFQTVEFPTLKKNPNVTSVTIINPDTGEEKVIFRR